MWLPMVGKAKISAINGQVTTGRLISQAGIDSINGLKGKTIAVTQGTTGDAVVRLALKSARMELGDVKIVSMDPSTIVTAFSSGQVDAAGLWYPLVDTVRARVPKLQELYTDKDANFLTCFVTQPDIAQRSPELLMATNRVFREANDWRRSNIPAAIDLVADLLKIPKAPLVAEATVHARYFSTAELDKLTADGTIGSWLRGTNEMFKEFGRVVEIVDPNKYYLGTQYTAARA